MLSGGAVLLALVLLHGERIANVPPARAVLALAWLIGCAGRARADPRRGGHAGAPPPARVAAVRARA